MKILLVFALWKRCLLPSFFLPFLPGKSWPCDRLFSVEVGVIGAKGATLNDWETTCGTVIDFNIFLLLSFVVRGTPQLPTALSAGSRSVHRAPYGSIPPSPRTPFLRPGFLSSSRLQASMCTSGLLWPASLVTPSSSEKPTAAAERDHVQRLRLRSSSRIWHNVRLFRHSQ